jgi:pseudouridine synthase
MKERLQKLIAEAGVASRRKAEEMITAGEVTVNGVVARELGTKADPETDHIRVNGKLINPQIIDRELLYVLLNKPRGYLSSTSDPQKRPLAIDLLPPNLRSKVHTVGRLDFNTEGLLILTNDGSLTQAVTRAGRVPKVYQVKVKGHPSEEQVERLRRGVVVDGRRTAPAEIELLEQTGADNTWYQVVLVEGRNQQIRKMFDAVGHSVVKLRRVQIGPITDVGLRLGAWRHLDEREVKQLLTGAAAAATPAPGAGKPGGPTRRPAVKASSKGARRKIPAKKSAAKAAPRPRGGGRGTQGRKR